MRQKITTCIVYVGAAITSLCLWGVPRYSGEFALVAIACALLVASSLAFRWPRLSRWVGVISALCASYWFCRLEFGYLFPALNTWITFNLPGAWPDSSQEISIAKLKIAFAIASLAATALSATRLLPAEWIIRKYPVRDRTWPALALTVLATLFWYAVSVSPYRIPIIVDAASPKLTLLHVEKNGGQFHETGISVFEDGQLYLWHNDRRLFQYRFPVEVGSAVQSSEDTTRKAAFALAAELASANTPPPVPLRSKDAEGWYIRTARRHVSAFTTENATATPQELENLFRALESAIPARKQREEEKDICFGFCYDPLAGLGLVYTNDRCIERNGTRCK